MNEQQLDSLKQWFSDYARTFQGEQAALPFALQLKLDHSLRVTDHMRQLATELGWSAEDVRTAEATGLLHDVARFSQFVEFGTFHDPRSLNHGERGWEICQKTGILDGLDPQERQSILEGVRFHNRRVIPEEVREPALRFVRLIRDADKIDIFQIVRTAMEKNQFIDHPEMLLHVSIEGPATPALLDELEKTRTASYKNLQTLADFLLVQLFWVYDIHYAPTFRMVSAHGVVETIESHLPVEERITRVVRAAQAYVAEKARSA